MNEEDRTDRIRIGVSRCLLGEKVRYDGGHKADRRIAKDLGTYLELLGVCPEVEYGLAVPREPLRLQGDPGRPRLIGRTSGVDHTEGMERWASQRVAELDSQGFSGFIFKSRSPSCGTRGVAVYGGPGARVRSGVGLFARAFVERFPLVPAEDSDRLDDPEIRESFIERVFVHWRWRRFEKRARPVRELIRFHTDHKLLILSHSPQHYTELGRLIAGSPKTKGCVTSAYGRLLMEGMRLTATRRKHTNVLHHVAGYFKKRLTTDEKKELIELIDRYRAGLAPLKAPIVLLNHYVKMYNESYLATQYYLNPHQLELPLRNHA